MKVSLEQPSSAGLILEDLARLGLWVWVHDKSSLRYKQASKDSLSVLSSGVKSTY